MKIYGDAVIDSTSQTSLFFRVSRWGVKPQFTATFAKRIILTNLLGFLFSLNMFLSVVAFTYYGHFKLALFTFAFACSELFWPLLNRAGHYTFSRTGMLISSNILGFLVSISLPGTGYNKGFYIMAGLPILLFELRERKFIALGLLLPLILYPVSEWSGIGLPHSLALSLTPVMTTTIGFTVGIIYILLIFLMFYFVARENDTAETALENSVKKVEDEKIKIQELHSELDAHRAKAFTSAKFAALGEMASGITHEINNPLTAINLHSQTLKILIESGSDKAELLSKLDLVSRTVHRIARIVESMSTISREGSNDAMKNEPLHQIVEDTTTFCAERFRKHSVKLTINVPKDIAIDCRAVQISQLLLNLLNNSFDAIELLPERWITLEATETKNLVRMMVADSGPGIPENLEKRIFDPFFTTKAAGKGTGLGLSLSSKIVQDHGGELFLDRSHSNTRFVIELPKSL